MSARKDYSELIGKKINHLTVVEALPERMRGLSWVRCKCDCGRERITPVFEFLYGKINSCGAKDCVYRYSSGHNPRYRDLTGKKFGYLTVIRDTGKRYANNTIWECKCNREGCGRICEVRSCALLTGNTQSCGQCGLQQERAAEHQRIYQTKDEQHLERIFKNMKQRCYNPNSEYYYLYGAKGVYICDEWLNDKMKFIKWALANGWKPGLEVDRYPDRNGPYAPWNTRIVTQAVNANNKRTDCFVEVNNIENTCANWDRYFGLGRGTFNRWVHKYGKDKVALFICHRMNGKNVTMKEVANGSI